MLRMRSASLKILKIGRVENLSFFESAIFFFKNYVLEWMGLNFYYVLRWFKAKNEGGNNKIAWVYGKTWYFAFEIYWPSNVKILVVRLLDLHVIAFNNKKRNNVLCIKLITSQKLHKAYQTNARLVYSSRSYYTTMY